jgi:integrase
LQKGERSWDFLRWQHIEPIINENEEIMAAKLCVYAGDAEEYYTFITPEAYKALKEWMDFRTSYDEKITGNSWVIRDLWQTTNMNYGAKWGLATNPKKLKSSGIKRLLERALWEQGIRQPLIDNTRRHEWNAAHGLRKYYKTRAISLTTFLSAYPNSSPPKNPPPTVAEMEPITSGLKP